MYNKVIVVQLFYIKTSPFIAGPWYSKRPFGSSVANSNEILP